MLCPVLAEPPVVGIHREKHPVERDMELMDKLNSGDAFLIDKPRPSS